MKPGNRPQFRSTLRAGLYLSVFLAALLPVAVSGQGLAGSGSGRIEGRYKFLPLPYINYNRSIGLSLGALPMLMFNPVERDTVSPSSVAGLLGIYSTNDTWFVLGFAKLFLAEDRWRVTAAGGLGSVNFQFYLADPVDLWVPFNTKANFAFVELQRRIVKNVYGGVSYLYMDFSNTTEVLPGSVATTLNGIGLKGTMDTRSNVYYPKKGFFTNLEYFAYPEALGNVVSSNTIDIDYNHYWPVSGERDVIAARGFVGLGLGDLSFNQQYIVGRQDIRGYSQGAFRGNYLLAAQAEYRWNFRERVGLVGFVGVATIFDGINEADNGRILPGIGVGVRYTAFTESHMNIGIDVAVGYQDWGIYFRIGEAF